MRALFLILVTATLLFGAFSRDNANDTVYDDVNDTTWMDNGTGPSKNWADAITYCNNLVFAGVDDWYLPSEVQWQSVIDTGQSSFDTINNYNYVWSSTAVDAASARYYSFWTDQWYDRSKWEAEMARCVRDGAIVNSAATDINITSNTVGDNMPAGTVVGTLAVVDADIGDTNTFALACVAPGADDGSFAISGNMLQSADVLVAQVKSSYSICIRATDSFGLTFDKNMTINVLVNSQTNADGSTTSAFFNIQDAMTYMDGDGNVVTEGTALAQDGRDVRVVATTYPDGKAEYRVNYDALGGESAVHFDIPGAETVVSDDANVTGTLSPVDFTDVNGTKVQVVVTTDNEGKSTSRYVATDVNNTQQTWWTADESTPFEPGNTIRVYDENATLHIEVKTQLTDTIRF